MSRREAQPGFPMTPCSRRNAQLSRRSFNLQVAPAPPFLERGWQGCTVGEGVDPGIVRFHCVSALSFRLLKMTRRLKAKGSTAHVCSPAGLRRPENKHSARRRSLSGAPSACAFCSQPPLRTAVVICRENAQVCDAELNQLCQLSSFPHRPPLLFRCDTERAPPPRHIKNRTRGQARMSRSVFATMYLLPFRPQVKSTGLRRMGRAADDKFRERASA